MLNTHRYFSALLLAGGLLATAACASRSYGNYGPYGGDYRYSQQFQRRAYDNGYREGREHGFDDVRHRRDFSYWRIGDYRDGDDGYRRGDGDRQTYREFFQRGFQEGYREAFNQSGYGSRGAVRRRP